MAPPAPAGGEKAAGAVGNPPVANQEKKPKAKSDPGGTANKFNLSKNKPASAPTRPYQRHARGTHSMKAAYREAILLGPEVAKNVLHTGEGIKTRQSYHDGGKRTRRRKRKKKHTRRRKYKKKKRRRKQTKRKQRRKKRKRNTKRKKRR